MYQPFMTIRRKLTKLKYKNVKFKCEIHTQYPTSIRVLFSGFASSLWTTLLVFSASFLLFFSLTSHLPLTSHHRRSLPLFCSLCFCLSLFLCSFLDDFNGDFYVLLNVNFLKFDGDFFVILRFLKIMYAFLG